MADDSELANPRKRKRKPRTVLSCNDCRRRKLKCDRELPCNRCINGGIPQNCVYGWNGSALPLDASLIISSEEPQESTPHIINQPSEEEWIDRRAPSAEGVGQPKTSPATTISKDDRVEQLEQRVASLEAHLLSLTAAPERKPQLLPARRLKSLDHEGTSALMGLFKGRNYRTFCYGHTSPMALITHVSYPKHLSRG